MSLKIQQFQSQAEHLYQTISGQKEKISVRFAPSINYAGVLCTKKILLIHPLTTLHPSDLPESLRVTGPLDQKLKNPLYFPKLKKWMGEKFNIEEKSFVDLETFFDLHLRLWQTHQSKKIRQFILAHEMAHIFHANPTKNWDRTASRFVACFPLAAFFYQPLISVFSCFLLYLISKKIFLFLRHYSNQIKETKADFTAYEIIKNIEGAKLFLRAIEENRKREWNNLSLFQKLIRSVCFPEKIFYPSHPSPRQRLHALQQLST